MEEANTDGCTLYRIGHCLTCERRDACESPHKAREVFGGTGYLKRMNTQANRNNSLLRACINHLTPSQASGILDEMPEIRERGFPDEWSASERLWSYAED